MSTISQSKFVAQLLVRFAVAILIIHAHRLRAGWFPVGPKGDINNAVQPVLNGRIRSIQTYSSASGIVIYAGASSGGLWRSPFVSPSWASIWSGVTNASIGAFAVHPGNQNDILAGTGDFKRYPGAGLFHTTDGGMSWTNIALTAAPTAFFALLYLPGNPSVVLAASDAGLFRSSAGAAGQWNQVIFRRVSDLVFHPANPNIQYACLCTTYGNDGGVYKSWDAGLTWTNLSGAVANQNLVGNARVAICHDNPNNVFFVYSTNLANGKQSIAGVFKSADDGVHWSDITGAIGGDSGEAEHALAIAVRPNDATDLFVGANRLWHRQGAAPDWTKLGLPATPHDDHTQLQFFPSLTGNDVLWDCNDGGIHAHFLSSGAGAPAVSFNGNSTTGLQVSQIDAMDAIRDLRAIGLQDNGSAASANAGGDWNGYNCCDAEAVAITDDLSPTFWYLVHEGNASKSVFSDASGQPQDVSDPAPLHALFYDRFSGQVFSYRDNQLVSRPATDSSRATWNLRYTFASVEGGLAMDRLNGQRLFAWGSAPGYLDILKPSGGNWTLLRSAPIGVGILVTKDIRAVYASTETVGESWACLKDANGYPTILHTTDDWLSQSDITGNLRDSLAVGDLWSIVAVPFQPGHLLLSTDTGVVSTTDGGASWQPFQTGLPTVQCRGLRYVVDATHNGNDKLVVGTYGHGLYEWLAPTLPVVYVDQRAASGGDGTFEHPMNTLASGLTLTPNGGRLALNGLTTYTVSSVLTNAMTISAYEAPVTLTH